jgi:hypothetical protein
VKLCKPETLIEHHLVEVVKFRLGGLCIKLTSPGRRGVPDRLCLLPNGLYFFVEVKREDGRLSKLQEITFKKFLSLGHPVYVVRSIEEVEKLCSRFA